MQHDSTKIDGPTVLLTGAAGVIGRAIARELTGFRVIGLVRAGGDPGTVAGVCELVPIDLTHPKLGLARPEWRRLASEADIIVHSGALAEWGRPWPEYRAANVEGTARVVELAQAAGAPIHQLSTVMVLAGLLGALDSLSEGNVLVSYARSKLEAERVVAESGVPHSVFRPTSLVGDSVTGASSAPQIVQQIADWFCRGRAPYFPAHPDNRIDLVPLDVTARAVAAAVANGELGQHYWLSYGDAALTAAEVVEVMAAHAAERGRTIAAVPVVDPAGPLPIPFERVAPTARAYLRVLTDLSEMTRTWGGVLPTSLPLLRERFGIPDADIGQALRASLRYWADRRTAVADTG
ncbi:SDR family oxidoreductase [Nocardia sp. CDC159]|uniref:SDR family oxidoreductase n=1 Tax=Nocardia pulmonis TaxID=2951408 RepID=A0A9X2E6J0_9NOCA|nr:MULTISPECIES: SDR family oxidoreductase [Nocardia]MCM6774560.1 SDR family oxidoreductase [Nocardia pulmonis]MCM6787375.1 SDR family oxidoreductase [Nocardia sp. CDC159]